MDTTNIIIPTVVCLTLAIVFYKKLKPKTYNKLSNKSSSVKTQNEEEKTNEKDIQNINDNNDDIKEEEKIEENKNNDNKIEQEEEEEEEETEEKKEKKKQKKRELTFKIIFDKFCEYVQKNKLVSIDEIAKKIKKTKDETIKFLRELENEGKMVGFVGDDGEYFYLTSKELDLLNNILLNSKNKNFTEEELEKQFQEIIKDREDALF